MSVNQKLIHAKDDRYFFKIKEPSSIIENHFRDNMLSANWQRYHYFKAWEIPPSVWLREKALSEINKEFKIQHAGILRIDPYNVYDWHRDDKRGAGINMLIQSEHSHSLFRRRLEVDHTGGLVQKTIELKYEPNAFYLFNTQIEHCVINFNEPRYLLSCEFEKPKQELSYINILNWIKSRP